MPKRNQKMFDLIKFFIFVLFLQSAQVLAKETIIISNPLGPNHSDTPLTVYMIDGANGLQSRNNFVQEFRVGFFDSTNPRHILTAPNEYVIDLIYQAVNEPPVGYKIQVLVTNNC